jgi:hypothetical protein
MTMAVHTITLSDDQELALSVFITDWRTAHPADVGTTDDEIVLVLVAEALAPALAAIEAAQQELREAALKLPEAVRAAMLTGLTAEQQERLEHLLPNPEDPV